MNLCVAACAAAVGVSATAESIARAWTSRGIGKWRPQELAALASPACQACGGRGAVLTTNAELDACACVARRAFRRCYRKFIEIQCRSRVGPRQQDYLADFEIIARRTLSPTEFRQFRLYFCDCAEEARCLEALRIERGRFRYAAARIEEKLGRAMRELEPYSLFPVDHYFSGRAAR